MIYRGQAAPSRAVTANVSAIAFFMGEALIRVASHYPTILDVTLEQVQNAIDAGARAISVVVNRKTSHVAIRDDGVGVSPADLQASLPDIEEVLGKGALILLS